jgi:hypothetical protein
MNTLEANSIKIGRICGKALGIMSSREIRAAQRRGAKPGFIDFEYHLKSKMRKLCPFAQATLNDSERKAATI